MKGIIVFIFLVSGLTTFAQNILKGVIVNDSGEAVENAHVQLKSLNRGAYSDANGEFVFENLVEGVYNLSISHISFAPISQRVELPLTERLTIILVPAITLADQVVIEATRADENTPTTFYNVSAEEIEESNYGQDIPVLLEFTPSVVSTSDAGAGIGYTGIRIRGSDATRINVTINGIPVNDSESHGVFWVNTPDLASSTSSIQVQRGVGTSTNGAAAFGATINLLTDSFEQDPYAEFNFAGGSFNTLKNTLRFGTGILENGWSVDGRLSAISSDGYIDRSNADLKSYYLSATYAGEKSILRFVTFAGKERTYQSWWGTPEARINNDVAGMNLVADNNGYSQAQRNNLLNSGRTFNYYLYEDQVDNYGQDHYQVHLNTNINEKTSFNAALHYTYGRGYYEEYKEDEDFIDYDIDPVETTNGTISSSDLIRRRWLDNHFVGGTFSVVREDERLNFIFGGAINQYSGDHFGEVIWSQFAPNIPKDYRYYDNSSVKLDMNAYTKLKYQLSDNLIAFADLQVRNIDYSASGPDNERVGGLPMIIDIDQNYTFFNPKFGVNYVPNPGDRIYLSYAIAQREPVRSDFIDNQNGSIPVPELLRNFELGYQKTSTRSSYQVNAYYMNYRDQLVLTGALNDVGASIRTNVESSYRAGIEAVGSIDLSNQFELGGNATLSTNKIKEYDEILYDYAPFTVETTRFENTDIAFSPGFIGMANLTFKPTKNMVTSLIGKYVGQQFLDNTSNVNRAIPSYFVSFFRASYDFQVKGLKQLSVGLLVNNLFNELYESNGYTFGYKFGGTEIRENYLYPQAERNFMVSMNIKF